MNRLVVAASAVVALLVGAAPARAEVVVSRVVVVRTGLESECASAAAVATAISRHAAFPARVVVPPVIAMQGVVEVRVRDEGAQLVVMLGGAVRGERVLETPPCVSIPDVVAAYVASVLQPLPELPEELRVEEAKEEEARGSEAPGARVRVLDHAQIERAVVLAEAVDGSVAGFRAARWVQLGTALVMGAVGLAVYADDERSGALGAGLVIGGTAIAVGGAVAAIAVPRSASAEAYGNASFMLGIGLTSVGYGLVGGDAWQEPYAISGAGLVLSGLWMMIDQQRDPAVSFGELQAIRARLKDPRARAEVTAEQLAAYERTFRRSRPRLRYLAPPIAGALLNIVRSFDAEEPDEQELGLGLGVTQLAVWGIIALVPDQVSRYERRLRKAGIGVGVAPVRGGMAVSMNGRF